MPCRLRSDPYNFKPSSDPTARLITFLFSNQHKKLSSGFLPGLRPRASVGWFPGIPPACASSPAGHGTCPSTHSPKHELINTDLYIHYVSESYDFLPPSRRKINFAPRSREFFVCLIPPPFSACCPLDPLIFPVGHVAPRPTIIFCKIHSPELKAGL